MKVLIMGLGLHGGGLESARYLLRHGADLCVTDLRDEQTLAPSIEQLEAAWGSGKKSAPIRYVLGRHETGDFTSADMIIKNPGVRPDSPYLQAARAKASVRIETDISLFLAAIGSTARLIAVTGSKGKSSTASALHWVLTQQGKNSPASKNITAYLGGNITVSPLAFLDGIKEGDDLVLELSSWQLGDIKGRYGSNGEALLKPKAAVLTPIMPDHLDRYGSMEAYIDDKRVIYRGQDSSDLTVARDDVWGRSFLAESQARPLVYSGVPLPETVSGGWTGDPAGPGFARIYGGFAGPQDGKTVELVPAQTLVPGLHQKQNLLAAGLALLGLGLSPEAIRDGLGSFPGVEHRLELFHRADGVDFYNDSAATIPEAATAAIEALGSDGRLVLVAGGTDKNLDFSPLIRAAGQAKAIILLDGSASDKMCVLFADANIGYLGPFNSLDKAITTALETAKPGDRVVLSPGCTSFGMFLNEFDRGKQWKEAVRRLA